MGTVFTASTDDPQMMRSLAWATLALKSPPSGAIRLWRSRAALSSGISRVWQPPGALWELG